MVERFAGAADLRHLQLLRVPEFSADVGADDRGVVSGLEREVPHADQDLPGEDALLLRGQRVASADGAVVDLPVGGPLAAGAWIPGRFVGALARTAPADRARAVGV